MQRALQVFLVIEERHRYAQGVVLDVDDDLALVQPCLYRFRVGYHQVDDLRAFFPRIGCLRLDTCFAQHAQKRRRQLTHALFDIGDADRLQELGAAPHHAQAEEARIAAFEAVRIVHVVKLLVGGSADHAQGPDKRGFQVADEFGAAINEAGAGQPQQTFVTADGDDVGSQR